MSHVDSETRKPGFSYLTEFNGFTAVDTRATQILGEQVNLLALKRL